MRLQYLGAFLLIPTFASGTALRAAEVSNADQPMKIDGVETVCTGGSANVRAEPRWRAYQTRLQFAGKGGEYLGDETVHITGGGKNISLHCADPWVLMKLPKGAYKLSTDVAGEGHKEMTIHAPGRTIVRFARTVGQVTKGG